MWPEKIDGVHHQRPHAIKSEFDTWIVMHEDLRSSERCRIVFDALVSGVSGYISQSSRH